MRRRLLYLLLTAATAVTAIFSAAQFPKFLLAFEVLFAAVQALWVHAAARRMEAAVVIAERTVRRGEQLTVQVQIKNNTVFSVANAALKLVLRDVTAQQGGADGEVCTAQRVIEGRTGAEALRTDVWQVRIQPLHCGMVGASLRELRIFDYLGLFSARVRLTGREALASVVPLMHPMKLPQELYAKGQTELPESVTAQAGSDTQEIFDTRLYQRGDTLRAVHWKLSAKSDELMVKEFSRPADRTVCVEADFGCSDVQEVTPEQRDVFLESCASVSGELLERGLTHEFIWYEPGCRAVHTSRVNSGASQRQLLEELLMIRAYRSDQKRQLRQGQTMLRVSADGSVAAVHNA